MRSTIARFLITALACIAAAAPVRRAAAEDEAPARERAQATPHHPGGIAWETTLEAAQAASTEDGRPVLAYFTFDT